MPRDEFAFKARRQNRSKNIHTQTKSLDLANTRQLIDASNIFFYKRPPIVRHTKAAAIQRELYRRLKFYIGLAFAINFAFEVQGEMNLRAELFGNRAGPFRPEPPSSGTANAVVVPARAAKRPTKTGVPSSGLMGRVAAQQYGYGKVPRHNVTSAQDLFESGDIAEFAARICDIFEQRDASGATNSHPSADSMTSEGLSATSTNSSTQQSNAVKTASAQPTNDWYDLSWLSRPFLDDTTDNEYLPSAWPFPGGAAAPARRRYHVTRTPHHNHQEGGNGGQGHHHNANGDHGHHHNGGSGHGHHHGHHNNISAVAPEPVLHQILGNILSRKEDLGVFLMQASGVDPYALYNRSSWALFDIPGSGDEPYLEPGIDSYIDYQTRAWTFTQRYAPEIKALPDLNKIFWSMIATVKEVAAQNITRELNETARSLHNFGYTIGGTYTLKTITLLEPTRGNDAWTREGDLQRSEMTSIGYLLEVDDKYLGRRESYIIAPAHHPPMIRVPTSKAGQDHWIRKHLNLFFNTKNKDINRYNIIVTSIFDSYANIHLAFEEAGSYLADSIVDAFKYQAYGETRLEKMIHRMQWVVPFYSAWLAYKRHEYTEAVVRTVLDVIAVASGPFAKAMQAAGMLTGSGRLVTVAKTLKKLSYLDAPGQVDNYNKKVAIGLAGQVAGPPGRKFAHYLAEHFAQDQDKNTMNRMLDGAYDERNVNLAQINNAAETNNGD